MTLYRLQADQQFPTSEGLARNLTAVTLLALFYAKMTTQFDRAYHGLSTEPRGALYFL